MNKLPSAQFRGQYARLTEPTVVIVHGHVIGTWLPAGPAMDPVIATSPTKLPGGGIQARQSQRDELLRKINRGK